MNSRLIVNGFELDLSENIAVPLNLSISDVKEPEKRKRSYSKSIKLEGTSNNMAFFLSAYALSMDVENSTNVSFDPSIRNSCEFYKNDLLIFKGKLKLNEVIIQEKNYYFDCTLFSDVVDIFTKLKDKKLNELDWSEYDHLLTRDNVINSWSTGIKLNGVDNRNFGADSYGYQPKSYGYVYPLVDYGFNKVNDTSFRTNQLFPFIYVQEACKKILDFALDGENIEVDYTTAFFENPNMKKLIYGYGGGEQLKLSQSLFDQMTTQFSATRANENITGILTKSSGFSFGNEYTINKLIPLIKTSTLSGITQDINTINQTSNNININAVGDYKATVTFTLNVNWFGGYNSGLSSQSSYIMIKADGKPKNQYNFALPNGSQTFSFEADMSLRANQKLSIELFVYGVNYDVNNLTVGMTAFSFNLSPNKNQIVKDNSTITIASSIPDIKCSDFLKGILNLFYAYMSDPIYDPTTNKSTIYIDSFINYYENASNYDEWSDKIDEKREITIQSNSLIEGQTYIYRFSEEKDFFNSEYKRITGFNYGEKIEQIKTWQTGEVKFELPFNTYVPVKVVNSSVIYPKIIEQSIDSKSQTTTKPYKGKGMITFYNGLKDGQVKIVNSNDDTESNSNYYPNIHHLRFGYKNLTPVFDLHFSSRNYTFDDIQVIPNLNTFEVYHSKFMNEITSINSKLVSLYLNLDYKDIHDLNFAKLKMIDGILYRLNAIKDFDSDAYGTTQVELLKYLG